MLAALPWDELGRHGGNPLHDPCTIAYLIAPELFCGRDCAVELITDSGPGRGQSIVDWWNADGAQSNAKVMNDVDSDAFFQLLNERLARL